MTYMPIIPIAPLLTAIGLMFFYACNKYFLLRHAQRPQIQQQHMAFNALDQILLIVLPQPLMASLLLSPSVDERAPLWISCVTVSMGLLFFGLFVRSSGLIFEKRLQRDRAPHVKCPQDHKMDIVTSETFEATFAEGSGENGDDIIVCQDCDSPVFVDDPEEFEEEDERNKKKFKHRPVCYRCRECESFGVRPILCRQCGENQKKSAMLKRSDIPYEDAKKYFITQYWIVNPMYKLFEDSFKFQEADEDAAVACGKNWEKAIYAENENKVREILYEYAVSQNFEITKKGKKCLGRYVEDLVEANNKPVRIVLQTKKQLTLLRESMDEEGRIHTRVTEKQIGHLLVPGWVTDDQLPDDEELEKGPVVLDFRRMVPTLVEAIEELQGPPWKAIRDDRSDEDRARWAQSHITLQTKTHEEIACDWGAWSTDEAFLRRFSPDSTTCIECDRDFDTHADLMKHYQRTNHDL